MADLLVEKHPVSANTEVSIETQPASTSKTHRLSSILVASSILLILFLNYFLSQFDKFVLSYFQTPLSEALNLSSSEYGILSGYATGIVYALMALPTAFVADYTESRVWVLSIATLWWSICVVFQGLSRNFWQILLARIGMGIGQAPVEALSVSLISDVVGPRWLFLGER
jgi:MFS family permease